MKYAFMFSEVSDLSGRIEELWYKIVHHMFKQKSTYLKLGIVHFHCDERTNEQK